MSMILRLEGLFRGVAAGLYPNAKFVSGTPDTVGQTRLNRDELLVGLYQGYQLTESTSDSYIAQNVGWFIGVRDNYSAKRPEFTLNAIASAEILMEQYNEKLKDASTSLVMEFGDFALSPQFKQNNESVSGIWCSTNIILAGCPPITYPDLSEYIGKISREISPLKTFKKTLGQKTLLDMAQ